MMLRVLVLIICGVQAASAETHTLIHDGTVSSHSPDITVRAKLDDEEIGYYDSDKGATPEQDWVKEEKHWDMSIQLAVPVLKTCKDAVRPEAEIRQRFGCGQSDDGKTSSFWNMTYKGQDFTLDRDSWSWTSEGRIPSDLPPEPNRKRTEQVLDQVCPECLKTLTRRRREAVDKGEVAYQRSHSPVTHSLRYFYTGTSGMTNFPEFVTVGLVDGQPFTYYDSNIRRETPRQDWISKSEGADYWERNTQNSIGAEQVFKVAVVDLPRRFNQTGGVHTWQLMYGCELDSDGTTRGFDQYGYDGADYISLDKSTLTWTAANQRAMTTKLKWEAIPTMAQQDKAYLENTCIEWLRKYVDYGRETLLRTERPQVSVYSSVSGSQGPEVTCLATGFFPKDIVVHLQRDGRDLQEDVQSGEVLPNGDGSFQVRKSLRVREEELKRHQYSCRVDHSSLREDIVKNMEPKGGFPIGIIVGVVVGVLVLIAVVGIVIWRKRQTGYDKASASDSDSNSSNNPPAKA